MVVRFVYILITAMVFLAIPEASFACGEREMQQEMACCSKHKETKQEEKPCCAKDSEKNKDNDTEEKGCNNTCKHAACHCPAIKTPVYLSSCIAIDLSVIAHKKKAYSVVSIDSLLTGHSAVWLLPKIS